MKRKQRAWLTVPVLGLFLLAALCGCGQGETPVEQPKAPAQVSEPYEIQKDDAGGCMILHLGDDVSVHSADIVAIIDLTQSQNPVTGAMLAEIRRQNRILARQGVVAKSAVICAGARRAGGMTENARVYLSPISTVTLAQRAHERAYPAADSLFEAAQESEQPEL